MVWYTPSILDKLNLTWIQKATYQAEISCFFLEDIELEDLTLGINIKANVKKEQMFMANATNKNVASNWFWIIIETGAVIKVSTLERR